MDDPKIVLVVMNAMKELSVDLFEWVLENFTFRDSDSITILGIKPWLTIPQSAKTWTDIWTLNIKDLSVFQENIDELKNDPRYKKVHRLVELCTKFGVFLSLIHNIISPQFGEIHSVVFFHEMPVVPKIRTEMGHPLRLLVEKQIGSLKPTYVVFDRYQDEKSTQYFEEKFPCHMIVMKEDGSVELRRGRSN